MKRLLLILLLLPLLVNAQLPIIKLIKTSRYQFHIGVNSGNDGLQTGCVDDLRGGAVGDSIWIFGGTDNFSTFKKVYGSGDKGVNWTQLADAPWSDRNAMGISSGGDRVYMWGGRNIGGTNFNDAWQYMTGAWSQISSNMGSVFGTTRSQFATTRTNTHFITMGGFLANDIIQSTDLTSWTVLAILPDSLKNTGEGNLSWDSTGNTLYFVGGNNGNLGDPLVGKLWQSLDSGITWTSIITNTIFKDQWPNITFCTWGAFYVRGNNGSANQQGCYVWYRGTDISNINNWHRLAYEVPARHASALFGSPNKQEAYLVCGNMWNESWWIKNLIQ